jgi:uncharacterized membrane protein
MTDDTMAQGQPGQLRTHRLEAFSDGVFAIAITLLVLEIAVPPGSGDDLLGAVVKQWPSYLTYVVSFSTIGAIWLGHSVVTEYLHRADAGLVRLNLLLLLVVSFMPFPTRLLGEYIGERRPERVAATVYGVTLFLAVVLLSVLWRYVLRERLVRPDAADEELAMLTARLTPGLTGYLFLIILGLFLPLAAVIGYLVIPLYLILPLRRHRRHRRGTAGG